MSNQIEKIIILSLPMRNFVFSDKISQNNFQNVAARIALRDLNLEFYKSESFPENHIVHEAQNLPLLGQGLRGISRVSLPSRPNASQN